MKHNINKTKQRVASEKKETLQSSKWSFKEILEYVVAVITIFVAGYSVGCFFTSRDNRFELIEQRMNYEKQLQEKDIIINSLKTEKTSLSEKDKQELLIYIKEHSNEK